MSYLTIWVPFGLIHLLRTELPKYPEISTRSHISLSCNDFNSSSIAASQVPRCSYTLTFSMAFQLLVQCVDENKELLDQLPVQEYLYHRQTLYFSKRLRMEKI